MFLNTDLIVLLYRIRMSYYLRVTRTSRFIAELTQLYFLFGFKKNKTIEY